jgi:hypothetical protein
MPKAENPAADFRSLPVVVPTLSGATPGPSPRKAGMIYSRENDFLFIKGRKIGGTSIEIALSALCGPDDIITPITPIDELERLRRGGRGAQNYSRHPARERRYLKQLALEGPDAVGKKSRGRDQIYTSHMSLREFIDRFGGLPTQRIFCVERSPYAKVISMAVMAANFAKYSRTGENMSLAPHEIIEAVTVQMRRGTAIETCRNVEQYRGTDGGIAVRALRHEKLAEDFAGLMDEYGFTPAPELPHAKRGMNSNSIDPHAVFTREQLDRVNEIFAEEFDTFGYERL